MENNIETLQKALIDVRKANRILFKYQEKMLDLAYYIKSRLDFPEFIGKKHFSNPIGSKRSGSGMQRIWHDMWAWDFNYSYLYEYYLGDVRLEKYDCQLSIVQYSDTGYFDQNIESVSPLDVLDFKSEDESISKFLFILQAVPKNHKNWKWDTDEIIKDKKYASSNHQQDVLLQSNSLLILYSFTLDQFMDEMTTIEALKKFCSYCEDNGINGLEIV